MARLLLGTLLVPLVVLGVACPERGGSGDDDDAADDDDASELPVVPDPGDADNDWGFAINDPCCSTPETAHPVGIVTRDAGYIQGSFDPSLNFFYVFEAGPELESFSFPMQFSDVHLHDGDGLRFGAELEPSETADFSVTWDVEPGGVYVVELFSEFEGFF